MRKLLITAVAGMFVFGVTSIAKATVIFNFDPLAVGASTAEIEAYMKDIYSSDITVSNASITNEGPLGSGTDHVMQNSDPDLPHWFEVSFNQVPITSVSFDWGTRWDAFCAYGDGQEFFSFVYEGDSNYHSGNVSWTFASPVTTLRFTDGKGGRIQLDNLQVTPVPEPSTLLFLGTGLLGLAGLLRRKRKV